MLGLSAHRRSCPYVFGSGHLLFADSCLSAQELSTLASDLTRGALDALAIYCVLQLADEIGDYIYLDLAATILLLSIHVLLNKPAVRK